MSSNAKSHCWRKSSECNTKITGFNVEQYPVCTVCKEELDIGLYEKIKNYQDETNTTGDEQELMDFWVNYGSDT